MKARGGRRLHCGRKASFGGRCGAYHGVPKRRPEARYGGGDPQPDPRQPAAGGRRV